MTVGPGFVRAGTRLANLREWVWFSLGASFMLSYTTSKQNT